MTLRTFLLLGLLTTLTAASLAQSLGKTAAPGAKAPKAGETVAILDTEKGQIVLKFFPKFAPGHVKNFTTLGKKGFYNGTKFHRTIPGFVIQGGDPNTRTGDRSIWGTGGPGYTIKGEMNGIPHTRGVLSMARSQERDSAGSQFFITVADVPSLNPGGMGPGSDGYTVFGQVISGMDVVDKIVALPAEQEIALNPVAIKKVTIAKWPVKVR
jgi:peptidyl-prolyl cis-trans isomerase B (cyclophilin B)